MRYSTTSLLITVLLFSFPAADAALPPEVRKELSDLSKELRPVTGMIRKKEVDEAKAIIKKIEDRLTELEIAEDEKDRSYKSLQTALQRAKGAIPVSFEREVAPIVKAKCMRCHGAGRASGNLRLDTYANMGKGGQNGPLLIPGSPQRSLMMARIMTDNAQARMPKGGAKLTDDEINVIGKWISQRAAFDGEDMTAEIGESAMEKKPPKPEIKVVMADGTETVSFKDDVAPWVVNVCLGCHSGNNPRGGYNLTTFETLLQGGDTGNTVVPGDPDGSYIVDLVLRQDPIKMPAGDQMRIKRSQAQALEKWIKEGAHFDGTDPKATLRSLVPTEEEMEAARLASMSDAEFSERRKEQAKSLWDRVAPREETSTSTTENLYVYGNLPQSRLDQIGAWGEEQVASLTSKYKLPNGQKPWRGRLILFVTKDRFDYEEFNTVLMNRRTPRSVSGHAVVSAGVANAYVAMHDVGDAGDANALPTQQLVNSFLAQAYLLRAGGTVPDWLQQGFGILESRAGNTSPYFQEIPQKAAAAVSTLNNPATLFENGTFEPDEVGAVGYLLTRYLINNGGMGKLSQLVRNMQTNRNVSRAVEATYGQSAANLGQAFLRSGG